MKYLHTMVRVADLDTSLRFYRDALGLQVVALASQLSALLVPALCGLLGCIALA